MSDVKRVALVTGASSGIGQATLVAYAKLGYRVAFTGRDKGRLEAALASAIDASPDKSPDNFLSIQADFVDPEQVEPIVDQVIAKFQRLDVLINNAGFLGAMRSIDHEEFYQDFQAILQVNLMAATRLAQLAAPHLKATKGVIINVSSVADRLAMPSISYSVSKAGMSMLTRTLANALDGTGVRSVAVTPGPIRTNILPEEVFDTVGTLNPLKRAGHSEEVANLITFLSSDKASFIHGSTIDIDGGQLNYFAGSMHKSMEALRSTGINSSGGAQEK